MAEVSQKEREQKGFYTELLVEGVILIERLKGSFSCEVSKIY